MLKRLPYQYAPIQIFSYSNLFKIYFLGKKRCGLEFELNSLGGRIRKIIVIGCYF